MGMDGCLCTTGPQEKEALSGVQGLLICSTTQALLHPAGKPAAGRHVAGGKQGEKLRELSLIFGAYDAVTAKIASDPRDRLDRLAERLREIPFAQGTDFWIDGFTDFTAQEERVLQQLMKQASSVTAGLVCDRAEADDGPGIFSTVRKTAESLLQMARRQGISAETEFLPDSGAASPALNHLRQHLLSGPPVPFSSDFREIELFEAETPFSEVEYAAARILRLVREEGCRFRDIAVAAPDFEEYAPAIEHIFARYGVPVFFSRRTDILKKPVPALILSALAVRTENYTYEAVFRYLKTGLTGIPAEDCSLLENYVLKWDIRGASWAREADWTMHPRGYILPWEGTKRCFTGIFPPENFARRCAFSGEAGRQSGLMHRLFRFPRGNRSSAELFRTTRQLAAAESKQLAPEYGQLWVYSLRRARSMVDLLGITQWIKFLRGPFLPAAYQYESVPFPPPWIRCARRQWSRVCFVPMIHLLLLGATDTAIPRIVTPPGLLSEEDRALLAGMGLPMKLQSEEQIFRELWTIRNACTAPESGLFISRPAGSADGTVLRPSLLQAQLQKLFPGLTPKRERELDGSYRTASPLPALEWAARRIFAGADDGGVLDALAGRPEYAAAANSIRAALAGRRGALSPQASDRLYGKNVQFSASRLDQYKSCHFAYFMRYGLKAKPRSPASLDAPQIGTFIHFVLENVLRDAAKGAGIRETSDELYCALTDEYIRRYAEEQLGGLDNQSARFRYLYKRLHKTVHAMVSNSVTELRASAFTPISFELGFGANGDLPPVILRRTASRSASADSWTGSTAM
jgi:ATP-dependent helicase/nuclease subunit B